MVLDIELHIDDVFITGEHGGFFIHILHAPLLEHAAHRLGAIADRGLADLGDLSLVDLLDGVRQMDMRPGNFGTDVAAEAENHARFIGLDYVDAGKHPDDERSENEPAQARPPLHLRHLRQRERRLRTGRTSTLTLVSVFIILVVSTRSIILTPSPGTFACGAPAVFLLLLPFFL